MTRLAFSDMILLAQEKQSFLHDLDPRTKLGLVLTVMVLSMLFLRFFLLLGMFIGLIVLVLAAKIFREWLKTLKGIFYLVFLIFVANTLVYGYSKAPKPLDLWDLQSWRGIFSLGMKYGGLLALRLVIFSGVIIFFVLTTDLEDLGVALRKMRFPYELVFVIVATARFIPVLIDDIETIIKARMVKGVEFQRGSFFTKIRRYAGLLVPLVIVSLRRSYRLAEAMDARGFGAEKQRTYYSEVNMRARDWFISILFFAILLTGFISRFSTFHP